ncbi:hypothetical protein [Candidatus Enterococcus ikei]|uniref:hypothetical protein n=1 Tax=Candidatus Enterococcus ikei TaxID=2815326 RepID=UPI0024143F5A|nr:hypothetical protein [Enterococcus sp. DIV0869a]
MLTGSFSQRMIERLDDLINELKHIGIRFRPEFYNSIITLAFLDSIKAIDFSVLEDYLALIEEKTALRFYKDFRQTLALGLLISEEMSMLSADNLNISALTITLMMAQEQAAAAVAIAASVSASNSSS